MTQGNGLVTTTQYNSRLQPTGIQAGTLFAITNRYDPDPSADLNCAGAPISVLGNNGNVLAQTVNGTNRIYSFDGVNRLCQSSQGSTWTESYSYDSRGNIGVNRTGSLPAVTAENIGATAAYSANNQVSTWAYDQAGNVTGIPASSGSTVRAACAVNILPGTAMLRTACYDAENRMVSETDADGATSTYSYDGDGRRVSKTVNGLTTVFVYDPMGQLAQEYGGPAIPVSESGTRYLTTDQLGSTRLLTDVSGNPAQMYDYLAFGEDFTLPTDTNRIRFTSKERDAETGLDYFGARYFSSAQGRFTSPDWSATPQPVPYADLTNPQSLNLYNYMRNNPLSDSDPDGHCCWDTLQQWIKSNPRTTQAVEGVGKIAVGGALVATIAGGDVPGSVAGAAMIASATIGATTTGVSGVTDVMGAATKTNVEEGQKALDAVSNVPALVTTAVTGNLKAGAVVGTLSDAAQLAAKPQEALKNAATTADAIKTGNSLVNIVSDTASAIRGLQGPAPTPPPAPPPPSVPKCSGSGVCQ